jgi:DNA polymerase
MQITGPTGEEARALKVMEEGGDIYGWFGTRIYGKPINKKDTPLERQVSKSAVLGLGFGMGAQRFIDYCRASGIHGITPEFAEFIIHLYRETFEGVTLFWRQCTKAIDALLRGVPGYTLPHTGISVVETALDPIFHQPAIRLPNGLYIKYPGLNKNGDGEVSYLDGAKFVKLFGGKTMENIVQALAALIMRMQKRELNKHYPVVMTTHDELVCLIPEDHGDTHSWSEEKQVWYKPKDGDGVFSKVARGIMTKPVSFFPGLPIDIESDTAYTYGDAK